MMAGTYGGTWSMPLEVVAAVIVDHGRILLTQRVPGKDYPWAWECPGGKVEAGETQRQALAREMMEELGMDVEVGDRTVFVSRLKASQKIVRAVNVHFYLTRIKDGHRPMMQMGVQMGVGWFSHDEMKRLDLAPANLDMVQTMQGFMALRHKVFGR